MAAAGFLCAVALHGSLAAQTTHLGWCLQVYLIEVNTSPALVRHGEVLKDLLPRVIEEVVQKVGSVLRITLGVAVRRTCAMSRCSRGVGEEGSLPGAGWKTCSLTKDSAASDLREHNVSPWICLIAAKPWTLLEAMHRGLRRPPRPACAAGCGPVLPCPHP